MFDDSLSLYIPYVFKGCEMHKFGRKGMNELKAYIAHVFHTNDIGSVSFVDLVERHDKKNSFKAYIYFNRWYDTVTAINFQIRVKDKFTNAYIVHNDPYYWIVDVNRNPNPFKLHYPRIVRNEQSQMVLKQALEFARYTDEMNISLNINKPRRQTACSIDEFTKEELCISASP